MTILSILHQLISDHMVIGFTTTCVISAYHHYSSDLESCTRRSVLDTT
jgi:hypothetical protein